MSKSGPAPIPPAERFWKHVEKADGCWRWTGAIGSGGYGNFAWTWKQIVGAHCAAWAISLGEELPTSCVLHRCDNRWCVNPEHLFLGSRGDNARDMAAKQRHLFGARNARAKLTDDGAREILANPGESCAKLGARLGVSRAAVLLVRRRVTWRHVASELGVNTLLH